MLLGEGIKPAIALSTMQMSCSSIYGSYINAKNGQFRPQSFIVLGLGGIVGAACGARLLAVVPSFWAAVVFTCMIVLALVKTFLTNPAGGASSNPRQIWLFLTGAVVGVFAGLVGIGGGFLLVPILAGILGLPLKNAVAIGLYFVMFVGGSAFITYSLMGYVDFTKGAFLSIGSILGVRFGIWIVSKTGANKHKIIVLLMYITLLAVMIYKLTKGTL